MNDSQKLQLPAAALVVMRRIEQAVPVLWPQGVGRPRDAEKLLHNLFLDLMEEVVDTLRNNEPTEIADAVDEWLEGGAQ